VLQISIFQDREVANAAEMLQPDISCCARCVGMRACPQGYWDIISGRRVGDSENVSRPRIVKSEDGRMTLRRGQRG